VNTHSKLASRVFYQSPDPSTASHQRDHKTRHAGHTSRHLPGYALRAGPDRWHVTSRAKISGLEPPASSLP